MGLFFNGVCAWKQYIKKTYPSLFQVLQISSFKKLIVYFKCFLNQLS